MMMVFNVHKLNDLKHFGNVMIVWWWHDDDIWGWYDDGKVVIWRWYGDDDDNDMMMVWWWCTGTLYVHSMWYSMMMLHRCTAWTTWSSSVQAPWTRGWLAPQVNMRPAAGDEGDDDIYIMTKCLYATFLLILPSPCQADNIYIMMKCVYVCVSVTFLLIFPSHCQADDIYVMMKFCLFVCHVFAYFPFPLPSWRYIYDGGVCVCLSRFCLFSLPPAKLTIYI